MNEKILHRFGIALGIVTGIFLLTLIEPKIDHDAEALKQHCLMVQLWNETNGEFGWPDYNGTAGGCK